jgi:hypothetical protein
MTALRCLLLDYVSDAVSEYSLSIAFDISTAFFVDSFSVAAQDGLPTGLAFSTDGTKDVYCWLTETEEIYEYDLSTRL